MDPSEEVAAMSPEEINKQLAEAYGFTEEQVSQMAEIYPALSLKDFFKAGTKEAVLEIIRDRGKQPIPVDKSQFEVAKEDIETILEEVDGKQVERKVVMKRVLVVRLLNTKDRGKIYSRIPSGSESTGLLKIEYQRLLDGKKIEGAIVRVTETKFEDKTGQEREGYNVEEMGREYLQQFLPAAEPEQKE